MQAELKDEDVQEIKGHFEFFDTDHNGNIDHEEFAELMKVISPESSASEVESGFKFIDGNNDGHIDWDEFIEWWRLNWCQFI